MTAARADIATDESRQLYLVDAMALAYRSHFVFMSRPLINSKGLNTSASYGFTSTLLKLIEDHGMAHMAVVFDAVGTEEGTFRDEIYDEYKANRSPVPEELVENLPYIKKIVRALDVPVIEIPGVEADDVIGTLARRAAEEGAEVVIVSADKDFQQLLDPNISIFRPSHRGEEFDPITIDTFRARYELEPVQFIDMLALMGDTSDNVPGVPGIGEKTAMKLLQEYGTVESLLEHTDQVKGKRAREGLLENHDAALLSKKLVAIKTDVEVDLDWRKCKREAPSQDDLLTLFSELEFSSLFTRVQSKNVVALNGDGATPPAIIPIRSATENGDVLTYAEDEVDYATIRNKNQLETLAANLQTADRFSFDARTTSAEAMWASIVGIAVCSETGKACYIPTPLSDGTTTDDVLKTLQPAFLTDALKVGHNVKDDLTAAARYGLRISGPLFDTMVAHYLLAPEESHSLDLLAMKYLNYRVAPITDLIGSGRDQLSVLDVPVDDFCPYACEDADISFQIAGVLLGELEKEGLLKIAEDIEMPLIRVLSDMELVGIRVDPYMLNEISEQLGGQIEVLERKIYDLANEEFNIASTQQLCEILFEKLGLPVISKTSKGAPSTKESVLEQLATEHPMPGLILDWRKLSKLKSTYVDSLPELIHPETGRVHTSFNQTVAATGRLSSSGPNLQNIPVRTDTGREIRRAFVPEKGWKLLSADYVQIELRILASMSGDPALQEAFQKSKDIHSEAAGRLFGVDPAEVTREQRNKVKQINYGIPYGISAWGLAQRLRTSVSEAQSLIDQYLQTYPRITSHINRVVESAHENGYVETLLGRRRFVPNINSRNRTQRSFAERVAVNMPIQGTQADMIKIAMVRLHRRIADEGLSARMLLQVHDELVFEAPEREMSRLQAIVLEEMVDALPLAVPIEVEMDVGENWLDAH